MAITLVHDCDIERRGDGSAPAAHEGDFRDTCLQENSPANPGNYMTIIAGCTEGPVKEGDPWFRTHGLLLYDLLSFLPADATITSAVLHVYIPATSAQATDVFKVSRCDPTTGAPEDWVETEATWTDYKSSTAWGTAGGDIFTPTITLAADYTATGWKTETITSLVTDAWDNRSGICTFIIYRDDDHMDTEGAIQIQAKNAYASVPEKVHHLRITYTLDGKTFQVVLR